jgi:hypothetical protein
MNLQFLGDALDHWKGSVLALLESTGALQRLAVDPMMSDATLWDEPAVEAYSRLLRIVPDQVVRHHVRIAARRQYFDEITHEGDLFLDPDTGVLPRSGGNGVDKYVKSTEVVQLLQRHSSRIVAVYQHARGSIGTRVDESVALVTEAVGSLPWCAYECTSVAMLFFSSNQSRVDSVTAALCAFLGCHAEQRVRSWVKDGAVQQRDEADER